MTRSSFRSRTARIWTFLALSPVALAACSGYSRNEILRYLPTECGEGQFYLDVSALTSLDSVKAKFKSPEQALGSLVGKSAEQKVLTNEILDTFKANQFNPLTDLKEIAACQTKSSDVYVALGGNFGGSGTLDKAKKLTEALSKSSPLPLTWTSNEQDGIRFLEGNGVWLYSPAKNILILGALGADRKDVSKRHEIPSNWHVDASTWLALTADESHLEVAKSGTDLRLTSEIGSQVLDTYNIDLKAMRDTAVGYLKVSPMSALAEPLNQFQITLKGGNAVVTGKIPIASINSIVESVLDSPTDFAKSLRPKPVDRSQCKMWMTHIESLFLADLASAIDTDCKKPATRKQVNDQIKAEMASLKDSFSEECDALGPGAGACIMAAQSLEDLQKCSLGSDGEGFTSSVDQLHTLAKTLCDGLDSMP